MSEFLERLVGGLEQIVVLARQRRVSAQFLKVIKQRRLNVIHEKISCVLDAGCFFRDTYIITNTEETARKVTP